MPARSAIRVSAAALCITLLPAVVSADERRAFAVDEPYYGDVLFDFYQQDYLPALIKLETSREFSRLGNHDAEAELLRGGMLLTWGQHAEAAEVFAAVSGSTDDAATRQRAYFFLGKVQYQRGYLAHAEQTLLRAGDQLPAELLAERQQMLARIYIEQDRYAEAAGLLDAANAGSAWRNYALYNQGVALVAQGQFAEGIARLDEVGQVQVDNEEAAALRDRANLAIGLAYLQQEQFADARTALNRVRLDGPYANSALLAAGWVAASGDDYSRALAPWQALSERERIDNAVQESLLALPYAFAQLDAQPQAAEFYAKAIDVYDAEIARVERAIDDAGDGRLVDALLADEQTELAGWNWQLAALPDDDRSRYLYFSIADHRFHEALESYRELAHVRDYLDAWQSRFEPWQEALARRQQSYAEKAPDILARIEALDVKALQTDKRLLANRIARARVERDLLAVATDAELSQDQRLRQVAADQAWYAPEAEALRNKHRLLKGSLTWDLERDYKLRVWRQNHAFNETEAELARVAERRDVTLAEVEAFPLRTAELQERAGAAATELQRVRAQLDELLQRHRDYLNRLAREELESQRERIRGYRAQARFGLAKTFDRMSMNTSSGERQP